MERLANADDLVGLEGEAPARMPEAVVDRLARVGVARGTIHGLQKEMLEVEGLEALGRRFGLRKDELQLVAAFQRERHGRLRAHAHPVDALRWCEGAVGLDGDTKAAAMQRVDGRGVELQQGLAARAHHEAVRARGTRPFALDRVGERFRVAELSAARTVGADEIGVAEIARGARAILFTAGPQVAAGEAAEDGGGAGVGALALQRVEGFPYRLPIQSL